MNVTLDICGTRKIKNPTQEDIQREVYALDTTKNEAFLILGPDDMNYIQTTGDSRNGFIVEYQENDVKHHYRAKRHLTTDETVSALASYAASSEDWKQTAEWEPVKW